MYVFGQDSWKATDRLTLNFGLRYDVTFIPPFGQSGTETQQGGISTGDMDFTTGNYILQHPPATCAVVGAPPCLPSATLPAHVIVDPRGKIAYNSYTNFGPRVGFAFLLDKRTAVRGGFGIVYDNWNAAVQTSQNISGAWPGTGLEGLTNLNQPTTASPTPTVQAQNQFGTSSFLPPSTQFTTGAT